MRRGSYISRLKVLTIVMMCIFLIINDLTDLADDESAEAPTKIVFSILLIIIVFCLLSNEKGNSEDISELVHAEKKA